MTDGRILEIAAGDEEITAAAAAAAAAGSSSDATPASATSEAALPSLQHLLQLPANASPLPALQLLFDMLVTQKTAGRRQAAALGTAQRRVAELEEALEVRSAALTASRLHTDKAVCEARWEALAQAKLLSRLSSGSEREAAQGAGAQLAQAQEQAQVLPDGEMLALLQSSAQQLMEAQQDAAGKARALEAAHAEISRLREIVASATGSSDGAGAGAAAAAAAQPATAAAAARPSSRAPSTTSTSSTASVASTASTSARQQAGSKGPSTRTSLPVPAQSLSATLTTIANALATTSTTAASSSNASKAAVGGRRGGGAAQQPHQRSDSGVPIVSVGIQELSAPLGRGASGGRLSSAATAASAAAAAATAAAASSENAQPPLQASDAAAGEAASLGWWKQRGVSVVGAKFAPPPAALQQASGPQVAAPVLQNLRSQLSAALPFSYGSTTEQARAAAAAAASLGTASGSSSAASSPGSEVLRAHSSLQELASPRRQ